MRPTPSGVSHPAVDSRSGDSYEFALSFQARSSVVEHYLDTVGVVGSKPIAPTKKARERGRLERVLHPAFCVEVPFAGD